MTTPWPPVLDLPRFTEPVLCAQADPDAFHPSKGDSSRAAKLLCGRCPARTECLAYALDRRLIAGWDGIWGGTSPRERQRMLRPAPKPRRTVAVCGTTSGYHAHRARDEEPCDACVEARRTYNREYQYRSGRRTRPAEGVGGMSVHLWEPYKDRSAAIFTDVSAVFPVPRPCRSEQTFDREARSRRSARDNRSVDISRPPRVMGAANAYPGGPRQAVEGLD